MSSGRSRPTTGKGSSLSTRPTSGTSRSLHMAADLGEVKRTMSDDDLNNERIRLHQAKLQRQELLAKLKDEHLTKEILQSNYLRGRYTTEPPPALLGATGQREPASKAADLLEMMIVQNAQLHQMIVQQLLLSSLPKSRSTHPQAPPTPLPLPPAPVPASVLPPPAVIHYHYDSPVAQRPAHNYPAYTSLPPIQLAPLKSNSRLVEPQRQQQQPLQQQAQRPIQSDPVVARKKLTKHRSPFTRLRAEKVDGWILAQQSVGKDEYSDELRSTNGGVASDEFLQYTVQQTLVRPRLDESLMFPLRIRDLIAAIHSIILSPQCKIGKMLRQVLADASLNLALPITDPSIDVKLKNKIFEDLAVLIENIVFELTEIMPSDGVAGTHKKSTVYKMIQTLEFYPKKYFFQIEEELLSVSSRSGMVSDTDSFIVLCGMFLGRALVGTLLLDPVKYKLVRSAPDARSQENLKILRTVFIYILRIIYVLPKNTPAPMPVEYETTLYSDADMANTYRKLTKSLEYAESLMRGWGKEYIKRLHNVKRGTK